MMHYSLGSKESCIRWDDINFLGPLVANEDICPVNISEEIKQNGIVRILGGGQTCSWLARRSAQKIILTQADFSAQTGLKLRLGAGMRFWTWHGK